MKATIGCLAACLFAWSSALAEPPNPIPPKQLELLQQAGNAKWVEKDHAKAAKLYQEAFSLGPITKRGYYLPAAESLALTQQPELAFECLDRELAAGWANPREGLSTYDFSAIKDDPRFASFIAKAEAARTAYLATVGVEAVGLSKGNADDTIRSWSADTSINPPELATRLAGWNEYAAPSRTGVWFAPGPPVIDGEPVHFMVYIPKGYQPTRRWPLMVWIPGGFWDRAQIFPPERQDHDSNPLTRYADELGFVLMHSTASKKFDTVQRRGMGAIRSQIAITKRLLNIDDSRVCYMGHSDGATGILRTACIDPTPFAAFAPICFMPVVGAAYANTSSRPIYSISGAKDSLYNVEKMMQVVDHARGTGSRWSAWIEPDADHGYAEWLDGVLPGFLRVVLGSMRSNRDRVEVASRVPPPGGRYSVDIDWLGIAEVDPARAPTAAHRPWAIDVDVGNGKTQRVSGETDWGYAQGVQTGNRFDVQTSRVAKLVVRIRHGTINAAEPVKVFVNGECRFDQTLTLESKAIVESFLKDFDRDHVWLAELRLDVPQ